MKDLEITCVHSAPSGTEIGQNKKVVYDIVKAHSKKRVSELGMGFINSQASGARCSVTGFEISAD